MENRKRYLKEKEVAEITGFSVHTLQRMRFEHKGINYIKLGRAIRYTMEDVLAYVESHHVKVNPNN